MDATKQAVAAPAAKRSFDVDLALERIRVAVQPFPKAALFELYDEGYRSVFQQLVACVISIRTYDEVMLKIAHQLFGRASTPEAIAGLEPGELEELVHGCAFYDAKARQIHAIAKATVEEHGRELPCDFDVLTSFSGVGPKCANLTLGIACGQARIGVDVHVHRVTNRWGYVSERTPEQTMVALEGKLPKKHWVEINRLLVPFGKHICTGSAPKCSSCPVLEMCQQVGVTAHR